MNFILRFIAVTVLTASSLVSILHAHEENTYNMHREAAISSAAGTPWNASRHLQLVEKATSLAPQLLDGDLLRNYPISEKDLEQLYAHANGKTLPFFTYSSMIDKEAGAVKAISAQAAATKTPAIAFGFQRTFNREMEAATVEKGWGSLARPNDLAILNVFEKKDAVLNGVLFQLPIEDLLILTKREVGYNLVPVLVMHWDEALDAESNGEIFLAYTFQAPSHLEEKTAFTNPNINPIPQYFNYLQKGLREMGEDFTALWWATTYLADQKTAVDVLPYKQVDLKKS